jgi:hypothetical protein
MSSSRITGSSRLLTLSCALAVAGALLCSGSSFGRAPDPEAFGPTFKFCKSFHAGSLRIDVYAHLVTCRRARAIQKELWLGPDSRKRVFNGGSGAAGYVLLKRFPGWRCGSGSGGGSCNKGKASAAYQN